MAWEDRLLLNMTLDEKGDVCEMLGRLGCTYMSNNTAPDGNITRVLQGLNALAKELVKSSEIDDSFS